MLCQHKKIKLLCHLKRLSEFTLKRDGKRKNKTKLFEIFIQLHLKFVRM